MGDRRRLINPVPLTPERREANAALAARRASKIAETNARIEEMRQEIREEHGNFESNPSPETPDRRRLTGSEVAASAPHRRLVVLEKLLDDIKSANRNRDH